MKLSTSDTRPVAGGHVTITASIGPNPGGGVVHWLVDGVALPDTPVAADGTAAIEVVVHAGQNVISAAFSGSDGFAPSSAALEVTALPPVPTACADPMAWTSGQGITATDVMNGRLVLLGTAASIDPSRFNPGTSPVAASSWALWYRSLYWLVPVAVQAYLAGDDRATSLVVAYVHGYDRLPDPGSATSATLARSNSIGWDEGTNLRREYALNCLVQLVPDAAVGSLLNEVVNANLDPNRYYGLPQRAPHNHGLMANLALIDSGTILNRPALIDVASRRLETDMAAVVDPGCGMVFEQSSSYQSTNITLWSRARGALAAIGRTDAAAAIGARVDQMATAYDLLVAPDGQLSAIGDGNPTPGFRLATHSSTRLLCRAAGWAAGRTDWSPSATFYALRFGPARIAHGHADHESIVWSTRGLPVLVDPGSALDVRPTWAAWDDTNAAHSVLGVSGANFTAGTSLIRAAVGPARDLYVLRDYAPGVTRTRSVRVDRSLPLLMVLDRAQSTTWRTFAQRWHFAGRWQWDALHHRLTSGAATAGVVSIDLATGRGVGVAASGGLLFPNGLTAVRAPVLSVTRAGRSTSIFSVVYASPSGVVPVVRWYPGALRSTGRVRVWWGRSYRDIYIDATGIRA